VEPDNWLGPENLTVQVEALVTFERRTIFFFENLGCLRLDHDFIILLFAVQRGALLRQQWKVHGELLGHLFLDCHLIFTCVDRAPITVRVHLLLDYIDHAAEEDFAFDQYWLPADAPTHFYRRCVHCFLVVVQLAVYDHRFSVWVKRLYGDLFPTQFDLFHIYALATTPRGIRATGKSALLGAAGTLERKTRR